MYELPQELSNNKKWGSFTKITKLIAHSVLPNLPCRNKNLALALENWINSAVKLSMIDKIHFSNLFISLKVFCEGLSDPPLISKLTKKVFHDNVTKKCYYQKPSIRSSFSKIDSENSLLGKLLMNYTPSIAPSISNIIVRVLNVLNCSRRECINLIQA